MRSKNKYDVYAWVNKVVAGAKTDEQKESASSLLNLFKRQFDINFITDKLLDDEIMFRQITI